MKRTVAALALVLAACGGGGGGIGGSVPPPTVQAFLTVDDVKRIAAQALAEAKARGLGAQVVIVDRSGNLLGHYILPDVPNTVFITGGHETTGGLETRLPIVFSTAAAISKALTGAYLSSNGNAFTTRTANQIVQEHFDPDESQQPSGPLFGVQFSQLGCSDVMRDASQGDVGPKRSPLGLAPDPGGLPLYKNGVLVGGVGVEFDRFYRVDRVITDVDDDAEEQVAVAGTYGFEAPDTIRANRITADGRTFRYVDSDHLVADPARAPTLEALGAVPYFEMGYATTIPRAGTAFGTAASGVRPDAGPLAAQGAYVIVDGSDANRFPVRGSTASNLAGTEVQAILAEGLAIAQRTRGQIRRPLGSTAEVTISVVDTAGEILGLVRTPDAPVFGIDVAVQKARTAMFFSTPGAAADLAAAPPAVYVGYAGGDTASIAAYVTATRAFLGDPAAFTGNIAWTARAISNIHRPFFPDGIDGTPAGPLSKPYADWSPFNVGLQLDLVNNWIVGSLAGVERPGCAGRTSIGQDPSTPDPGIPRIRNGIQIFPGGVPIYRGNTLVGAVGVSGDGVDQDDMISLLGLANAARKLGSGIGNAPAAMRADTLTPMGTRLRYVQCPQSPFNDSTEQNVCAGL